MPVGQVPMYRQTAVRLVATGLLALGLAGCSDDMGDLRRYVEDVKQRPGGNIDPIPEMKPFETFTYPERPLRDPFEQLSFAEPEPDVGPSTGGPQPKKGRQREPLEDFQLDSLTYVGTLEQNGQTWGLVKDPSGTIHRVQGGNYLGKNYGRIEQISSSQIELRELIPNQRGGWIERTAALKLND